MAATLRRRLNVVLLAGLCAVASAQPLPGPGIAASLPNCVSDSRLDFGAADERVLLDDEERVGMGALMQQRYPVLAGFAPDAVVLWRQRGADWLYVALTKSERVPGGWCVSASFTASAFDVTPALLRKYFFRGTGQS